MATDYGGQAAYDAQAWPGGGPGPGTQSGVAGQPRFTPGPGGPRRRAPGGHGGHGGPGRLAAVALLVAGVVGLSVSLAGAGTQVLPRQFTAQQRQQILDWEASQRWRELPAGTIFPALVRYPAPSVIGGGAALSLTASRIGIARQASCPAATDAAIHAALIRSGCQAVLRATYTDATDSYVVTVGVAAFSAAAEAKAAQRELSAATLAGAGGAGGAGAGVLPVSFRNTPAAWFKDNRRQLSASTSAYTYVVFYTVGYADSRPLVQVSSDKYAAAEMTSLGAGVVQAVMNVLAKPLPSPHCPGTPGC